MMGGYDSVLLLCFVAVGTMILCWCMMLCWCSDAVLALRFSAAGGMGAGVLMISRCCVGIMIHCCCCDSV